MTHFLSDCDSFQDILGFALPSSFKQHFLIVLSAFAWTIWNSRNNVCFNHAAIENVRYLVTRIVHLVSYWTGDLDGTDSPGRADWLPQNMEDIPPQEWNPATEGQIVDVDSEGDSAHWSEK